MTATGPAPRASEFHRWNAVTLNASRNLTRLTPAFTRSVRRDELRDPVSPNFVALAFQVHAVVGEVGLQPVRTRELRVDVDERHIGGGEAREAPVKLLDLSLHRRAPDPFGLRL